MVGNSLMPVRTVFARAMDRLLPKKLADVDERSTLRCPRFSREVSRDCHPDLERADDDIRE